MSNKAIFLDSDGVLNTALLKEGKPVAPTTLVELEIPSEVKPALEKLKAAGYLLICVTNKPDVERGLMTQETVDAIYKKMRAQLPLDDVFICYEENSACYKPKPGLLWDAAKKYDIDLSRSYMIGDRWRDIGAGQNAPCKTIWIDRHYAEQKPNPPANFTADSLMQAAEYILKTSYQISASLLSADFARLGEQAQAVIDAGADTLHLDAMDNHFVPQLTIGPLICSALRRYGIKADINVHLMAQPVDKLIVDFAKAGATRIIFHPQTSDNVAHSIQLIKEQDCKVGLALSPLVTIDVINDVLDTLDFILVMSVNPGFAGQPFISATLDKIKKAREIITAHGTDIRLGVDGGVKVENIATIAQAGADTFITGSAIFNQPDYAAVILAMRKELSN
jgi:ribulose-phosphate 3-epimerase